MSTCKSCGAPVLWAKHATTGTLMPLDPQPSPAGNIWLVGGKRSGTVPICRVASQPVPAPEGANLYTSHFATCPNAAQHRRRP